MPRADFDLPPPNLGLAGLVNSGFIVRPPGAPPDRAVQFELRLRLTTTPF